MANPPTKGSMGLGLGKWHSLENEVRLVILVCFILTLPVLQMHDYQALSKKLYRTAKKRSNPKQQSSTYSSVTDTINSYS